MTYRQSQLVRSSRPFLLGLLGLGLSGTPSFCQDVLFVGSSVSGDQDPWVLIDESGTVVESSGSPLTDGCSGAAYHPGTRELFVASTIQARVIGASAAPGAPILTQSSFASSVPPSAIGQSGAYGAAIDPIRQRLYTLARDFPGSNLCVFDIRPTSPTYGDLIDQAPVPGIERWALSFDRDWVLTGDYSGDAYSVTSLDPMDPGYLVPIDLPIAPDADQIAWVDEFDFGHQDRHAILTATDQNLDAWILRFDLQTWTWVDVDPSTPGCQHIYLPNARGPFQLAVIPGTSTAVLLGSDNGTQPSRGLLDFGETPELWDFRPYKDADFADLAFARGLSISPDASRAAVTSTSPSEVFLFDPLSGERIHSVPMPAGLGNLYTTEWLERAPLGTGYCSPQAPSSTGVPASIEVLGSPLAGLNQISLRASDLPSGQFTRFLASMTQGSVPGAGGSQGTLCLGGSVLRLGLVQASSAAGTALLNLDLTQMPTQPASAVLAGQTWNFQAWFRDSNPGGTSNFSDASSVLFE